MNTNANETLDNTPKEPTKYVVKNTKKVDSNLSGKIVHSNMLSDLNILEIDSSRATFSRNDTNVDKEEDRAISENKEWITVDGENHLQFAVLIDGRTKIYK